MKRMLIIAIVLLLSYPQLALVCNETVSRDMVVPSVNDAGDGQLVAIKLKIREGDGTVYIATAPIVGSLTQESGQTATQVATEMTGHERNTCDVLLKIGEMELSSIDGPSAGAAITLLLLSALGNNTLRDDFTITGTIEPNGIIGPVGGIPIKAQAAADAGLDLLVTPYLSAEERIMLDVLGHGVNITIVQVENIQEAERIAFSRGAPNITGPKLRVVQVPSVPDMGFLNPKIIPFERIARDIIEYARNDVDSMPEEQSEYKDYFSNQLDIAEDSVDKRYIYTGANTAFITWIDIGFLKSSGVGRNEIEKRLDGIEECYQNALDAKASRDNWEWVVGGQLRASWAKKKISGINNESFKNQVKTLETLRDVTYAENWCVASKSLMDIEGRETIDLEMFKPIAIETIDAAEEYLHGRKDLFPDQNWHLEAAKQEFDDGLYGAAVYDATYAIYMTKGYDYVVGGGDPIEIIETANNIEYDSIWANLYIGQAKYIELQDRVGITPVQLSEFSNGLENRTKVMYDTIENGGDSTVKELFALVFITVLLVMVALAMAIMKRL
ncbi:MAG: S16 family serine protease [Candidatus Micrarchaeota archaeon]